MELTEAKNCVDRALDGGRLAVVVGRCRVQYEGRAASKLSEGDRVLIIKNDGTFLVHQPKGMAAINYQGPGASITTGLQDGELVVSALRNKKNLKERIHVRFFDVYSAQSFSLKDDKSLALFGSERQLSDLIMQDLCVIEEGMVPVQQESEVRKGTIDILARDKNGKLAVIEVKRRGAGLDAVSQLERYVSELSKRKGVSVRGILCSPRITPNAHAMLEKAGLEFFRLDYEIGNPSAKIKGLQKKQKVLEEY